MVYRQLRKLQDDCDFLWTEQQNEKRRWQQTESQQKGLGRNGQSSEGEPEGATVIEANGEELINHSRCYQGMVKSYGYWALLLMTLAKAISGDGISEGWRGSAD